MNGRKVAKGCGIAVAGWLGLSMCAGVVGTVAGGEASPVASSPVASVTTTPATPVAPVTPVTSAAPAKPAPTSPPATPHTAKGDAADILDTLPVKGRAPKVGYDRDLFPHWLDGPSGCPADVDAVKAAASVELAGTCKIAAASLTDPYTGDALSWSGSRAGVVDVDHVVALGDAWQKGAQAWDAGKRARFANDPLNLAAVSASANRAKGDGDAATWLPPRKAYRCQYVARQVRVKVAYGLWVTQAEKDAIVRVLDSCDGSGPTRAPTPTRTPKRTVAPSPSRTTPDAPEPATRNAPAIPTTCKAAKAAGLGPYTRGVDPEYDQFNGRDGDGIVCE